MNIKLSLNINSGEETVGTILLHHLEDNTWGATLSDRRGATLHYSLVSFVSHKTIFYRDTSTQLIKDAVEYLKQTKGLPDLKAVPYHPPISCSL